MVSKVLEIWKKGKKTQLGQFLLLLGQDTRETDIFNHAYAMAYVTLFSLVPSLAAVFALVSLFTPMFGENSSLIVEGRELILKHLATGSGEQAINYLENFINNTDFKKIGMTGFAGMVVTLTLLLKQIELALNRIFEIEEPRTLYMRFIYFWTFLTLGTFSIALAAGAISSTTWGSSYLEASLSLRILNDSIYTLSLFAFFFMLYKVVPNRYIPVKHAAIGGLFATILFSLAVQFFSLYITRFTRYQAIYGALAALPIFLFWLYVIWLITLLGASITKRCIDGITVLGAKEEEQHPHIQTPYFQSILPFIALIKIHEAFAKQQGQGAEAKDIAAQLGISLPASRRALHQLVGTQLILATQAEGGGVEKECRYFPRQPLDRLSYLEIRQKLLGSEALWLSNTKIEGPEQDLYRRGIGYFISGENRSPADDFVFGKALT